MYYELGHGLCANPYWHQCPYRMACVRCEFYVPGERAQYVRATGRASAACWRRSL